jgi:hypothetical protein
MTLINLTDHFNSPTGEFVGYLDQNGNQVVSGKHYDLRSFHSDTITLANSMINYRNINAHGLEGDTMLQLNTRIPFDGTSVPPMNMGALDVLKMTGMDSNRVMNFEGNVVPGNEDWTSVSSFSIARDPSYNYANVLNVPLTGGVEADITSQYTDDIFTNWQDETYVIELQLLNFPAQTDPAHLDLNNSFIDFTSSPTYAGALTDTFTFAQSTNNITGGGNINWQVPRSALTHVDLTNITGIRFRLKSVGNMTFKTASMRMYSVDNSIMFDLNSNSRIDTKRGWVYKRFPHYTVSGDYGLNEYGAGDYNIGGSSSPGTASVMILPGSRPKNITVVSKFMPATTLVSAPSTLTLYGRYYDHPVQGSVSWSNAGTTLSLGDVGGNIYTSSTLANLSANQEYFLVFEAYEDQLRVSVWNGTGTFFGSNVATSGWHTTTHTVGRGYIGFKYDPQNYDSYLKYFTVGDSEFARYESKPLKRLTNSRGASITAVASPPINLVQGVYNNYGDATSSTSTTKGFPIPPSLYVQRSGAQWKGGLITNSLFIGNPAYLSLSGSIFPIPTGTNINGEYKIIFENDWGEIGYVATLQNILPNQWNSFNIPFNGQLAADEYKVIFEQTGYFADSFYLSNFALSYLTFAWEISPDNGATFYPFYTAANKEFSGSNFINSPGKSLIVRGIALTDQSWIQSYELVPLRNH